MRLIFDIETNGLYQEATKVWCLVIKDVDTQWSNIFTSNFDNIEKGIFYLNEADELIGHNIIGFDIPVLKKLYSNFKPKGKLTDTLIMSRLFNPDRPIVSISGKSAHSAHSLASWGERLGFPKGNHSDWTQFSQEMLDYCIQDVNVTHKLYQHLTLERGGWDWEKSLNIENKIQEIITQQEINGWYFDIDKAQQLVTLLETKCEVIDKEIIDAVPKQLVHISTVNKPFKINGQLSAQAQKYLSIFDSQTLGVETVNYQYIRGPFSVIDYENINLNSEKQIKDLLLSRGWEPLEWNVKKDKRGKPIRDAEGNFEKTSPKLTLESFESLNDDLGLKIAERTKIRHRKSQIEGWLTAIRDDNRIEAQCNTIGTNTGRMRHRIVVNVPKAKDSVFLGKEMRSLFTVPEGKALVGCDAAGLELRMLAHFMDDEEFTNSLIHGDIHKFNADKAGLPDRELAKTFIYGLIYGAGDEKIGKIISKDKLEGTRLRKRFMKNLPSLGALIDKVKSAATRGYLRGLDGRKLFVRNEYSALNVLLQAAGAVVMKIAICFLDKSLKCAKLDYKIVGNFHDEFEIECNPEDIEKVRRISEDSIRKAGEYFKLKCPLKGESKAGVTWAEVH